jgi:chromosome partitioning protein
MRDFPLRTSFLGQNRKKLDNPTKHVTLTLMDQLPVTPRGSVKLKIAMEFCRFSGSPDSFRALLPGAMKGVGDKHNVYTPADIRRARLKLMGVEQEPVPKGRPPIIYARMTRGGVGKTTIAGNVAATIACMGHRVLLIDGDPQATLTSMFGINWAEDPNIFHIGGMLRAHADDVPIDWDNGKVIRSIYPDHMLDIIPADITLAGIEPWLTTLTNREACVNRLIEDNLTVFSRYDVIVIDSAPGTTQLSNALMYAARKVLAVVRPDGSTLKAMEVLSMDVRAMNKAFRELKIEVRIVANDYDSRIATCKIALDTLREAYQGKIDPNVIPRYASFVRQVDMFDDKKSGPILEREPNSPAAKAIIDLSRSLIGTFEVQLAGMLPVVPETPRRLRNIGRAAA